MLLFRKIKGHTLPYFIHLTMWSFENKKNQIIIKTIKKKIKVKMKNFLGKLVYI